MTLEAAQEHCSYVVLVPTLGSGRGNVVKEDRECKVQATKMQRKFCCGEATSPEMVQHVPKVEVVQHVPKVEVQVQEKIVEVPQIHVVEKLVDLPQIQVQEAVKVKSQKSRCRCGRRSLRSLKSRPLREF